MKTSIVKEADISPNFCLKIKPQNEAEKVFINHLFGQVQKMGDIEFVTVEKNSKIEEIILYKLEK